MVDTIDRRDDGFELEGTFYRWHVTDTGKDLMLIDRFTGMPVADFFETIEDSFDRGRAPVLLALMATSMRAKHPDWSVERIARVVQGVSLGDVTFVDSDAEAQPIPPAEGGQTPPASTEQSDGSSSSSTPPETSTPEDRTSSETQPFSSSPGSPTGIQEREALTT
jgi:hypothetical protein